MIALFQESKTLLEKELHDRQILTKDALDESVSISNVQEYMQKVMDIMFRWVKVQAIDEKSVVSAMIIDQIMKIVMLKLD